MEKIEETEQWQQKVQLETKNGAALWKAIHISLILIFFVIVTICVFKFLIAHCDFTNF